MERIFQICPTFSTLPAVLLQLRLERDNHLPTSTPFDVIVDVTRGSAVVSPLLFQTSLGKDISRRANGDASIISRSNRGEIDTNVCRNVSQCFGYKFEVGLSIDRPDSKSTPSLPLQLSSN